MTSILGSTRAVKETWSSDFPGQTIQASTGKEVRCPTFRCGRLICKVGIASGWIEFRCSRCKALYKIVLVNEK